MSDELDPSDDATQERVRRLLSEARHEGPVPVEVAARLDRTIQDLVETRHADAARTAALFELDARRRRRRWTAGLAAAAAAVVAGVTLPNVIGGLSGLSAGEDAASGGGTAADAPSATSELESDREFSGSGPGEDSDDSTFGASPDAAAPLAGAVTVQPGRFKRDALAARESAEPGGATDVAPRPSVCGAVPETARQVVVVRYDGQGGYLVFEPEGATHQRVTLYLCPGGVPARQALVPVP